MEQLFKKQTDSLDAIFAFLSDAGKAMALPEELMPMLHLVVEEIFVNLVRYNTESCNDVTVRMSCEGRTLTITLVDRDVDGYDLTRHADVDTTRPAHERRPGGLGIHLVREMMDEVRYAHENRTSTITLIKHLGAADVES